jgi:hypothetical protein
MMGFPIICRFQVFLFPPTHIGWPTFYRADQIYDQVETRSLCLTLRTRSDEPPADDFRFCKLGLLRLGIQFPSQVVWDA